MSTKKIDLDKSQKIHFIGVGGIGMSAIAKILLEKKYNISGSDLKESINTIRLKDLGATIFYEHDASNIRDADLVVVSSAINDDNVEVIAAKNKGISIIKRAEMLALIMPDSNKKIAITGTHGKTTTTSMLTKVFKVCGEDPTFVVGGNLSETEITGNAGMGSGKYFIFEADESDGSFLFLKPTIAVITSIEAEHMNYFGTMKRVKEAYLSFAKLVPKGSYIVINYDYEFCRELMKELQGIKIITYGLHENAEYRPINQRYHEKGSWYEVVKGNKILGAVKLRVPGEHNIINSLAAIAISNEEGLRFSRVANALERFIGAKRRFQLIGKANGVLFFDDYAHHPTEIKATLKAAKAGWGRRVICIFQPHRFTRTQHLTEEFGESFGDADHVIISEIFSAGEEPIKNISGKNIVEVIEKRTKKTPVYFPRKDEIAEYLVSIIQKGDIVITMGAGDIHTVGKEIYQRLKQRQEKEKKVASQLT